MRTTDLHARSPLDERGVLDICGNLIAAPSARALADYAATLECFYRDDPRWPALAVIAETRLELINEGDSE